ncbi:THAP domain-containing protein 9 [Plakobranchus ocellatus]|uniref:THAP domain-containing protein 9 n=1 Tax=Plakobranchus ocellatus TaxID=259542 RepID=A0AAV3YI12_9GAST|nr:THAP domain-containing protein 9 [Plakobranchus ocellatus]
MQSLENKVKEARKQGNEVLCSLMLDEMAIMKKIQFDGKKTFGFIDIGSGVTDDGAPAATQALVFMVVCVNGSWKVPIGFFFIHGMTGKEKANLVRECLHQLGQIGIKFISLTCDGPSCYFAMLSDLGASMDPENLDPSFPHPSSGHKIFVILDVCHMLKLLRNCLASKDRGLKDGDGVPIRWKYLEDLNSIQEREGLHLANKLRKAHICWTTQKVKVNLAAQSFSASVADALEYCQDGLHLLDFQNVQGTVRFLRFVNHLFDVLNSRNQYAKGMKGPLKPDMPDGGCTKMLFLEEAF